LLVRGLPNAEIVAAVKVSKNTVRFPHNPIYKKLGVINRTEAVAWRFQQKQK